MKINFNFMNHMLYFHTNQIWHYIRLVRFKKKRIRFELVIMYLNSLV